jgi:hypothetical protein
MFWHKNCVVIMEFRVDGLYKTISINILWMGLLMYKAKDVNWLYQQV